MIHYKLLVVHWSIFTLSVQLIYCATLHSTRDSAMTSAGGVGLSSSSSSSSITVSPTYKSSQTVAHQSICYAETEHVLGINGKESSIILDLEPNRIQMGPCKRTFKAPDSYGFIVKFLKFKSKQMRNPNSHIDSNIGGVSNDVYNETTTCPLNIMSGKDPLAPAWKLDPCKMEAFGITKEIVRLTEGYLRISWTPNHHSPKYKLIITTLGKGYHCNQGKHPCMKFGQETLFCVSSSLMCDGIHHCPPGDEYNSDEDPAMCARHRGISDSNTSFGMSIWQQISKEIFSKLLPSEVESSSSTTTTTTAIPSIKTLNKPSTMNNNNNNNKKLNKNDGDIIDDDDLDDDDDISTDDNSMESSTKKNHRSITFSRGLSKFGPWGYLILGMLLCGAALLVCVLWGSSSNSNFNAQQTETQLPPNYDEIDPPPSYSTLFPGKAIESTESSTNEHVTQIQPSPVANQPNTIIVCSTQPTMLTTNAQVTNTTTSGHPSSSSTT